MSLTKKIILGILSVLAVLTVTVTAFGMKVYLDGQKAMEKTYQSLGTKEDNDKKKNTVKATKPFSVLLMGIDTGTTDRKEQWTGRSDSMLVVTLNPTDKQTTILSLDRDSLVHFKGPTDNPYSHDYNDKLNHTYAYGGPEMTLATVNNLLNVDITYYVTINMQGVSDLVDAVDGIDVENKLGIDIYIYDTEPNHTAVIHPGKQHLNGEEALVYSRMRHFDPEGDIGRQKRQREVIQAIVKKILSLGSVSNYQKIFDAVSKNLKTDISFESMLDISEGYRDCFDNVKQYQLQGEGEMINSTYYQLLPQKELETVREVLHKQLELPDATLEKLQAEVADGTLITYEDQMGTTGPDFDPDVSDKPKTSSTSTKTSGTKTTQSETKN